MKSFLLGIAAIILAGCGPLYVEPGGGTVIETGGYYGVAPGIYWGRAWFAGPVYRPWGGGGGHGPVVVQTNSFHPNPVTHSPLGDSTGFAPGHSSAPAHSPLGGSVGTGGGHHHR
jgi:hypothetical protein